MSGHMYSNGPGGRTKYVNGSSSEHDLVFCAVNGLHRNFILCVPESPCLKGAGSVSAIIKMLICISLLCGY